MEKSCFSLAAGLMREALGSSEVGAKTRPPWASAEESAAIHPIAESGGNGEEQSGVCEEGRQRVHAQVAGDGAVDAVTEEAAPGEGKGRHHGKQDEGSRHTGGSADQIAAAGDLAFLAGFLAASRGCLFGLVVLCHSQSASASGQNAILGHGFSRVACEPRFVSVVKFQNPFRGIEGAAEAGVEETRPEGDRAAETAPGRAGS